jgi:hypothetical protein
MRAVFLRFGCVRHKKSPGFAARAVGSSWVGSVGLHSLAKVSQGIMTVLEQLIEDLFGNLFLHFLVALCPIMEGGDELFFAPIWMRLL